MSFICPKCSSTHWGTSDPAHPDWSKATGHCHGNGCDFSWNREKDDSKYMREETGMECRLEGAGEWESMEQECYKYAKHLMKNKDLFGIEDCAVLVGFVTAERYNRQKAEKELEMLKNNRHRLPDTESKSGQVLILNEKTKKMGWT